MKSTTEIRQQIKESGKPIRRIAREAGVNYLNLWRWVRGITPNLKYGMAVQLAEHFARGIK